MKPACFLVTGAAGFIGFHLAHRLLKQGQLVIGVDDLNECTDPVLKHRRLSVLQQEPNFIFYRSDITDKTALFEVFSAHPIDIVIHFAAKTGVRASALDPLGTVKTNIEGFALVLEACRIHGIAHLFYASSSSIYGNGIGPMSLDSDTDHPLSLYAATKKADELMAQVYSTSYGLASTGLRFFTVYGPYGRPDMAVTQFAQKIMAKEPITLFNQGQMARDFTYIDDLIEALDKLIQQVQIQSPTIKHRCFNVGHGHPVELHTLVKTLEEILGQKAIVILGAANPFDPINTCADNSSLVHEIGPLTMTPLDEGLKRFVFWLKKEESTP